MAFEYTPEQKKVIQLRKRNILVAAAAGSGKTAVLVERIISMISDKEQPVDIDRLLVVTFTNAAAAEMRERISLAISKKLEIEPEDENLQRQAILIHNAQITTIDSFCLFVIRNHFNDIGLDPGFRVADVGELKLLRQDVLEQLLEEQFEKKEEAFLHCVETYGTTGSDSLLEEMILKLYDFSVSYPWPRQWLEKCKSELVIEGTDRIEEQKWYDFLSKYSHSIIEDAKAQLELLCGICEEPDGPYMYGELLETECQSLQNVLNTNNLNEFEEKLQLVVFNRLPGKKDDSVNAMKKDLVKDLRQSIKKGIEELNHKFFFATYEKKMEDMKASAKAVSSLLDLALEFGRIYEEKKLEKNMVDFSDMEHYALNILLVEKDGEAVPTKTAEGFKDYFHEILIDEYQDSNLVQEYLLKSISKESFGKSNQEFNRFMVGDVKQSIYKFRLARPEIFMEKYNLYKTEDSLQQKIDLHQNFRSRLEVIDSVNYIFEQIMEESVGGVNYDQAAALNLGAFYDDFNQNQNTELLLLEKPSSEEETDLSAHEMEAMMVATKIKKMVGNFMITDKSLEEGKRVAQYKDIVILLRSSAGYDESFKKILEEEGIPVYVESKTGYFSAYEVQLVLNMLRILVNPLQDIPLCSVLLSTIIGFSEEELAIIRSEMRLKHSKKEKIYNSCFNYILEGKDRILAEKTNKFFLLFEKYRQKIFYTSIHHLLLELLDEFSIQHYAGALPSGEQRMANIDMLIEKAVAFENTSYHGLFQFVRYIEKLEKYEVDYGEAATLDENANVVRIMTIHKSKGLEFPICILAGISKKFNNRDIYKTIIADVDFGIGTDYINPILRTKTPTIRKNAIGLKMKVDNVGEELRILYVAMTRAKEKLILSGTVNNLSKKITEFSDVIKNKNTVLGYGKRAAATSYLDLIVCALVRHRSFELYIQETGLEADKSNIRYSQGPEFSIQKLTMENLVIKGMEILFEKNVLKEQLNFFKKEGIVNESLREEIDNRFSYSYPNKILSKLYTKTTVSELKKAAMHQDQEDHMLFLEPQIIPYVPKFMKTAEEITGTVRGSAYHKVLELLDFERIRNKEDYKNALDQMLATKRLSKEYVSAVDADKILAFLQSDLSKRMIKAEKNNLLWKEQPFVIGVSANEIDPLFPKEETILVQGIIDVYYSEEGGLVVADYKTDRVTMEEELILRYQTQLNYYATALETLTGIPVKEKIIYSFALLKQIILP